MRLMAGLSTPGCGSTDIRTAVRLSKTAATRTEETQVLDPVVVILAVHMAIAFAHAPAVNPKWRMHSLVP